MWSWKISSLNRIFLVDFVVAVELELAYIQIYVLVAAGAEAAAAAAVGGRVSFALLVRRDVYTILSDSARYSPIS